MAANEPAAPGAPSADGNLDSQQWAIQRRIDDVFAKLGEKFGDLTGRIVVRIKPDTTFAQIGGLREAKSIVRSFATVLTDPELYRKWGITPPKGVLLYGPPGTGKSLLARALATETGAVFYHLKLMNVTSKFGPNSGELIQEILAVAKEQGKGVLFFDEINALSLEHLLPPAQARESSARLVAALGEPHRSGRRVAGRPGTSRSPGRGDAARRSRPAGDPRDGPQAGRGQCGACALRRDRLPLGSASHGRDERRGAVRDHPAGARAEGARGRAGARQRARHDPRPAPADRPLPPHPGDGREDPLRAVPLAGARSLVQGGRMAAH